ncbi:MAG TPA: FlgD immunoglobulin-like domain containing protein [Candidatus Eisenbacteria bacterium]|nr:FlgD immunoglobulin-like domain containing protein [Candidatus Eisenbacteria bacterium]
MTPARAVARIPCAARFLVAATAAILLAGLILPTRALRSSTPAVGDYVNFEGLQVRPLAMTPDGSKLLAVNTPDSRLEIFAPGGGSLTSLGEIPVGLEPVAVAALHDTIAWVVNHVSDDVSIVNLNTRSVLATLRVGDEPTDVLFAGTPRRAFVCVSGEDAVKIYGLANPSAPTLDLVRPIFGRHPRALAAGGGEVYVGVLDAGNRTTCLPADVVQSGGGPPPPSPPRSLQSPAPAVGLIVQKVGASWVDERPASSKTWNSVIPFDLPDQDVHVLDAGTGALLRTVSDVGTNLFNLAVGPSGSVYVTHTEAFNRTRFEPNLRGRFLHNRIARIAPGGVSPDALWHLNSHIVYDTIPGPPEEKALSLSQPMDLVVNAAETRIYVAALGSDRVGVVNAASGAVLNRIPSSPAPSPARSGPTGLFLDEARGQLYVMNRFSSSIGIVNVASETCVAEIPMRFDPSPPEILEGRRFLYDGSLSDHGDLACASCHIGGNLDNIGWDLGNPRGSLEPVPPGQPLPIPPFDPMKGPMTTQSLRGLRDTSPFHWRGDRLDFTRFNPAFVGLMGNPDTLSSADMQRFSDFVMTMVYPPNPNQNLDRTWPDPPAPAPSPTRGKVEFDTVPHDAGVCTNCHSFPTGTNRTIIPAQALQESQAFKVPHVRNMYQKTGFRRAPGPQKRGFGFLHDGSIDDLFAFLNLPVFQFANDQQRRDLEAFLLSFDTGLGPAVGRQLTVNATTKGLAANAAALDSLCLQADLTDCDLVARAYVDGSRRSYAYTGGGLFQSDYDPEGSLQSAALRSLPDAPGETVTFLGVPRGSGIRMGIDRDRDGYKDRWELALGSDPADPASIPAITAVAAPASTPAARLLQNAPNPFNPATAIGYEVERAGPVKLHVFDVSGRMVRTLVDRHVPAGSHVVRWDGRDDRGRSLGSGRYFYRLRTGEKILTREMTLVR